MYYCTIDDNDVFVEVTTLEMQLAAITESHRQETLKRLCITGGALVVHLTEEALQHIQVSGVLNSQAREQFTEVKSGYYITLIEDFMIGLEKSEVEALFQHEVGHLKHGMPETTAENTQCGILMSLEDELAADAYAVQQVGTQVVQSALIKLLGNRYRVAEQYGFQLPDTIDNLVQIDMADPFMKVRLETLQALSATAH